jgi:hypothetical protein
MQTIRFTNLHQLGPAALATLANLVDACIGERCNNPDRTCVAAVTLLECDVEVRGIPSVTRNGLEVFIPGSDATLRCDFGGMLHLTIEMEG